MFSRTKQFEQSRLWTTAVTPVLAVALCAGAGAAQDYEWEPDEGLHQEEWYDPSDWFDDDPGIDYESDWYENYDSYSGAYYDGYYDGYYDDEFGYDHWDDGWSNTYSSAYTDGYYDGYYDRTSQYAYDPYYYIYTVDVSPPDQQRDTQMQGDRQRDQQRREGDRTRTRGDRADDRPDRATAEREKAKTLSALSFIRGDVEEISEAEIQTGQRQGEDQQKDHTVLRISFENREPVIADFGPHMTRDQLPFDTGERISLVGKQKEKDGQQVLVVNRIVDEGKTYTLRGGKQDRKSDKPQQDRRQRTPGGN